MHNDKKMMSENSSFLKYPLENIKNIKVKKKDNVKKNKKFFFSIDLFKFRLI